MIAVFALDVMTFLGAATGVLYFVPLTLCLATSRPMAPLVVGGLSVLLIAAGYVISPPAPTGEFVDIAQLNRSLSAAVVITLAVAGRWFITTKGRVELQEWVKAGQTELSARMRGEQEVGELARNLLSFLAEYVGSQVGSVHVACAADSLALRGTWGLDASGLETVRYGETLVGQVAAEGRTLLVEDVPDGYMNVTSGTGSAKPRSLILVPARADDAVNGVLELGFFTSPGAAVLQLLEGVSESVGVAIRSAQYRQRQAELLEEWQAQAEELTQQQEELRAVNEMLEEQTHKAEMQAMSLQATETVLRQKAAELERASRYKSEFLANMSHELRTPLNSSLILAKLLIDNREGNLSDKQIKYARRIYSAGNDLLAVINDILDLSKIEAGRVELHLEKLPVHLLIAELENRFEPLAGEKGLTLRFSADPSCPESFETDQLRLQQILTNLLSNALKFTAEGTISLTVKRRGTQLAFVVEDTGIGIDPEQHEVVFEAFRQADGTTNRKYGGTGLGLSICRELATLLGGEISLDSERGRGSTFTVTLPQVPREGSARAAEPRSASASSVERVPSQPAATPPAADRGSPAPAKEATNGAAHRDPDQRLLLIIEDDPAFAQISCELAEEHHFEVLLTESSEEGLRMARESTPDAIILDIGLPDGSGLALLDSLKRDATTRHIAVHVVSAHDHQQLAREMGAVGYALKPVQRDALAVAFQDLQDRFSRTIKNVLVVEDDPVQLDAIAQLLEGEQVRVTPVDSSLRALEALRSKTFDCVVLDLMLPDVSGFEVLERMCEDGTSSVPPVIIYTARLLTAAEEQALRRHSRSIIIKGARSPERLLEEVTLFLHQVESDLSPEKQRMLRDARDRDAFFDGRRVLLVEDDVRNIFALTSVLEPMGLEVDVARNGNEALARLQASPPVDLILMDVMMPEMDGLEATRAIRASEVANRAADGPNGHVEVPIIAVTAKAMPDDRHDCLAAGANDYIAKPVDVDQLLSLLRVWMPR